MRINDIFFPMDVYPANAPATTWRKRVPRNSNAMGAQSRQKNRVIKYQR